MAIVLLRTVSVQSQPGEWDHTYTLYSGTYQSPAYTTEYGASYRSEAFELLVGDIVEDVCGIPRIGDTSGTRHVTRYAGNGVVSYDAPEYNATSCPAATCDVVANGGSAQIVLPTTPTASDGSIRLTATTSRPPLQFLLTGTNNTTGLASGHFTGLPVGTYTIRIEDAVGCIAQAGPFILISDTGSGPRFWLKYTVEPDLMDPQPNRWLQIGYYYNFTTRAAGYSYGDYSPTYEPDYSRPTNEVVDSYYLPDNVTFRRVYHDGNGGLLFDDTVATPPAGAGLRFVNIIRTDIDQGGSDTGRVLLEASNDGAGGVITYVRVATNEQNTTGSFSGLPAGPHIFRATDPSGQLVEETVTIEDRYRLRWHLVVIGNFAEPEEVLIYERDYDGEPERVCGDGDNEAITRAWTGQTDPAAELPELVGQSATVVLRSDNPLAFEVLSTGDDRRHRVDIRSGISQKLEFRGYASPDLFRVAIHEGLPAITINASCGLATLRDTLFRNHLGQNITESGRWPILHTLLHCLSRCDVNLPLYVGIQLREQLLTASEETLAAIAADRSAYGEEPVLSEVVEALLRPFKAVLWQARGAWWVASELDLALLDEAKWTQYSPAGEAEPDELPPPAEGLDLWAIKYPNFLSTDRHLVWISPGAEQATVAAAKVVQAVVKFQLRENNLPGGDLQDWNPAGTLPTPGWSGGPGLRIRGEKAGEYALRLYGDELLTAGMSTFPAPNYSPILLTFKARSQRPVAPQGEPAVTTEFRIVVLTDGLPDAQELSFAIPAGGPEAKFQEYSVLLPSNRTGQSVRLRLSTPGSGFGLDIAYLRLQILPALVEWPEQDQVTVIRPDGVLKAPDVSLVHADLPRLALAPNEYAPAQDMDALAWRHALTTVAGKPTTLWNRPGVRLAAPLLETAALDRLELRQSAQRTLSGSLLGYAGVGAMSFGQKVISPDAPGRLLLVVSCEVQQVTGVARLTLRAIGAAPDNPLPDGARVTTAGIVRSLRSGVIRIRLPA